MLDRDLRRGTLFRFAAENVRQLGERCGVDRARLTELVIGHHGFLCGRWSFCAMAGSSENEAEQGK